MGKFFGGLAIGIIIGFLLPQVFPDGIEQAIASAGHEITNIVQRAVP
jgi:hypothetical protein